eukprot:g12718.t1
MKHILMSSTLVQIKLNKFDLSDTSPRIVHLSKTTLTTLKTSKCYHLQMSAKEKRKGKRKEPEPKKSAGASEAKDESAVEMEVDSMGDSTQINDKQLQLQILDLIKTSQIENGMRHNDYGAYRLYCGRRLDRLRKTLKFQHGRNFKKRKLDESKVTSSLFLTLPLYNAERCWSHAMQLKEDLEAEPRKKFHLRKRLNRAAQWSEQLHQLCLQTADARTQLESEAYGCWMAGNLHLEYDRHAQALEKFMRARGVWDQLGAMSNSRVQALCQDMSRQIGHRITFCKYQIERVSGTTAAKAMSQLHVDDDDLKQKLAGLANQVHLQQAETLDSVSWQGKSLAVTSETCKLKVIEARDLEAQVQEMTGTDIDQEKRAEVYRDIAACYEDANKALASSILEAERDSRNLSVAQERAAQNLRALSTYFKFKKLEAAARRNVAALCSMAHRYLSPPLPQPAQSTSSSSSSSSSSSTASESSTTAPASRSRLKAVRPEELVVLTGRVLTAVKELSVLQRSELGESKQRVEAESLYQSFLALRAFFLAEAEYRAGALPQAWSLFAASQQIFKALSKLPTDPDLGLLGGEDLVARVNKAVATRLVLVQASAVLKQAAELKEAQQGVAGISLDDQKGQSRLYLMDRLEQYDGGDPKQHHNLVQFPPGLTPVACKPILFDIAHDHLAYPIDTKATEKQAKPAKAKKESKKKGKDKGKDKPTEEGAVPKKKNKKKSKKEDAAREQQGGGWLGAVTGGWLGGGGTQ